MIKTVLAIDLGSANLAYALVSQEEETFLLSEPPTYLHMKQFKIGDRLLQIRSSLHQTLAKYPKRIASIVFEDSVFKGANAPGLHYVAGIFHLVSSELQIPIVSFKPTEVKKKVSGSGTADKEVLAESVKSMLRYPKDFTFENNHCSDAVAIGLCYFLGTPF